MDPSSNFFDISSDGSDGGSQLTSSIFSAVSNLGAAAIISQSSPNMYTPYPPPTSTRSLFTGTGVGTTGSSSGLLWIIILVVLGFFAFSYIKK